MAKKLLTNLDRYTEDQLEMVARHIADGMERDASIIQTIASKAVFCVSVGSPVRDWGQQALEEMAEVDQAYRLVNFEIPVPVPGVKSIQLDESVYLQKATAVLYFGKLRNIYIWAPHGSHASYGKQRTSETYARGCSLVSVYACLS